MILLFCEGFFSSPKIQVFEKVESRILCRNRTNSKQFSYIYVYILNENSTDTPCSHWHTHSIASECAVETAVYSFIHSLESCE